MKIQIILAMTLCQWVKSNWCFGAAYCLHIQGQLVPLSDPADGSNKLLRSNQHYLQIGMAKYATGL